jgi:hypothetical protein
MMEGFPMRALVLALAAVLVLPPAAGAQQAWVKAYEDGVKEFQRGNDALAEAKLIEAREKGPKLQSRRHNYHSLVYRPFIPDFYLGVIYARTRRHKLAQEYLERALRDQLVKEDDRANFALAQTSLEKVREEQGRLASSTRPNTTPEVRPPASTTTTPPASTSNVTPTNPSTQTPPQTQQPNNAATPPPVRPNPPPVNPPANAEPTWLAGFRRSMQEARTALEQSRYTDARSSLAAARSLPLDTVRRQEADTLGRSIDITQNMEAQRIADRARSAIIKKDIDVAVTQVARLETLAPSHAALPELRGGIERLRSAQQGVADLAKIERLGVRLFLSGNYKESAAELERAVGDGVSSPRIHLFLASSRAAQALLAPESEKPALIAAARKHYALAKPASGALAADQRFISTSIRQLLTGS